MTTVSSGPAAAPEHSLRRFRDTRDPDALGALFDATAPALLRVALSIAPDAASAENALQETFLAVLQAPERWDDSRPVMPWLLGILHRQVGKARRDGARTPDPFRVAPPLRDDDPAAAAMSREEMDRARAAIDELPEPYRAVAVLRWRHGLDPAEIADVRGEPPGTTRSLLSRALEKLRARLGGAAFALFGVPSARGLRGIRRTLMSRATAASVAGTTVGVGGAIVMKKVVAACLAAVLIAGGTWWAVERTSKSSVETARVAAAPAATPPAERKRTRAPAPEAAPASAPAVDELPPPVDLDKCDRDLDLFGRVVDEDGKPVAGARATTVSYPWRRVGSGAPERYSVEAAGPTTRTARDGTFVLRLTRGAMVDLRVVADGFGEVVRDNCPAGERVTLTLSRGATLSVVAVDAADKPVSGVRVTVERRRQFETVQQSREGTTDENGRVAFDGIRPGPMYLQFVHPTLAEPEFKMREMPASGPFEVRVTMAAGRTIRGRVTDADSGAPIRGARVGRGWTLVRAVTTDADGRFEFPGWVGGVMAAAAADYGSVWKKVESGDEMDFALRLGDRVRGRLLRADGSPVADGFVAVRGAGTQTRAHDDLGARTGPDGRFDLGGLQREMPHTLTAAAPGCGRTSLDFDPAPASRGTIELGDVVLPAARCIEGLATDGDGKPLADRLVSLVGENDGRGRLRPGATPPATRGYEQRRTDDLGRFRFGDLSPGTYELRIFAGEDVAYPPTTTATLPADHDLLDVRVKLAGSRSMTVLVVDEAGGPIEKVSVDAGDAFGWESTGMSSRHPLNGWTGPDGRVAFHGMPAVEAKVSAYDSSGRFASARVAPFVPDGREVRVVMRRAATVAGFVRDADGAPVPRLSVKAVPHEGGADAGWAESAADGSFSVKVPAGESVDLSVEGWEVVDLPSGARTSRATDWRGDSKDVVAPAAGVALVVRKKVIARDRKLVVVVRDSAGAPMAGFHVVAYGHTVRGDVRAISDADGRAALEGLPAETCRVSVNDWRIDPRRLPLDVPPKAVDLVPDGQEIVAAYRAGAAIRGRVVDAQGAPLPRALVDVQTDDYVRYTVQCDDTGLFRTAGIAGHAVKLTGRAFVAGAQVVGEKVEGVVPGDAEVTIVVAPKSK